MWHKSRFEYHPSKTKVNCICCGKDMYFPKCKAGKYLTCSDKCRKIQKEKINKSREKECPVCHKIFIPRPYQIKHGIGNHCSHKCSTHLRVEASKTPEAIAKRVNSFTTNFKNGKFSFPKGEDHPKWQGGAREARQRRIKSGKAKETLKKYRQANPDKIREWTHTRKSRKFGKLPRGTINNLLASQENMCNICKIDITNKYHLDHIMPLAKGGTHTVDNVQLLCPKCNLRKASKHPEVFLKEMGLL